MINSRKIEDLLPVVRERVEKMIADCEAEGIELLVTSTYRDNFSQAALYAQGRTTPGRIVTNARAGQSFHNWRVAFDFVPVVAGKARWDDKDAYATCGKIAESIGLEWAGRWIGKLKETAHCQYTGGLSLSDFQKGKTL